MLQTPQQITRRNELLITLMKKKYPSSELRNISNEFLNVHRNFATFSRRKIYFRRTVKKNCLFLIYFWKLKRLDILFVCIVPDNNMHGLIINPGCHKSPKLKISSLSVELYLSLSKSEYIFLYVQWYDSIINSTNLSHDFHILRTLLSWLK